MKEYNIAKLLLLNGYLTSQKTPNGIMLGKCPACGSHHNEKFKYDYYTGSILICPKTGIKIYAVYIS